jgi:hypothetical protein
MVLMVESSKATAAAQVTKVSKVSQNVINPYPR